MPTAMIDRRQRIGLYELVRNHLGGLDDVHIALENEDFALAERLGIEFDEDFRLLEDIGWSPCEGGESFALTMPRNCLMEMLKRLHDEAEAVLSESITEREAKEADAETNARLQLGKDACEGLLVDLVGREGERA